MGDLSGHDDDRQKVNVQGNGNQIIQIVGSHNQVTLPGAQALRLIEDGNGDGPKPAPDKGGTAGFTPTGYQETRLLWAPNRKSLRFRGRKAEISALWQWLTAENGISAHIITGAGGRGKTRLAVELAAKARAGGWLAGFAGRDAFAPFNSAGSRWAWTQPTLIIVDYVAAKAEALKIALAALVNHPPAQNAPKLRFLLLERSGTPESFWWRHLFGGTDHRDGPIADLLDPSHVIPLQGLAEEDRFAVFAEAYELASGKSAPDRSPAWDQTLAQLSLGGEPLFLAMTGLALARQGLTAKDGLTADKLAFDLAEQEQKRIETHWIAAGLPKPHPSSLPAHLAAVTTLCDGLEEAAAHAMIAEESAALHQAIPSGNTDAAYTALHQALPGDGGAIAPLLPDILGEALILRAFDQLSDKGSAALTRANNRARRVVFDTVVRCGRDFIIRGKSLPLNWLKQLHAESEGDLAALIDLANALPPATVELRKVAADITQSLAERARALKAPMLLAAVLNNLANRLADMGEREKALAAAAESVALHRSLAARNPAAFNPNLARALNTLSIGHARLGEREKALAAAAESVPLFRSLAAQNPAGFNPDLARALSTLSNGHAELGQREKALAAAAESVPLFRSLAAQNPAAFNSDLAGALNNLSNRFAQLGEREKALAAAAESVPLYRSLAAQNPEAFNPDLALALNTLSNRFTQLGEREKALAAAAESVPLFRSLAAQNPAAFNPDLARALSSLSNGHAELGQREKALAAAAESVALYRSLAAQNPGAYKPDLARALNNLSNCHALLGEREKALAAAAKSVPLFRSLAAQNPVAFNPDLARVLNTLSNRLAQLGEREKALAAAAESVDIRRVLASQNPAAFNPDLARALNNLSNCHADMGQREKALTAATESVDILRVLVSQNPAAFAANLATSLGAFAKRLTAMDRTGEARDAIHEAIVTLSPQFLELPHAVARLMGSLVRDYLTYCEAAETEPDETLLAPIIAHFQSLSPGDTQDAD